MKITIEHVRSARSAFASSLEDIGKQLGDAGVEPTRASPAAIEEALRGGHDALRATRSQSSMLIESLFDHLGALDRTLTEPVLTVAPYSCLRPALEASTLACWLLQENLESRQRLCRSLSLRLHGLEQQRKLAEAVSLLADGVLRRRDELLAQISALDLTVAALGGSPHQVHESPPDMSSLTKQIFGSSSHYRILSAMLHVQPWAIIQLSFQIVSIDPEARESTYSKGLANEMVLYMLTFAAELVAKPAWLWAVYCGLRRPELRQSLDAMYDALELKGLTRPWAVDDAG